MNQILLVDDMPEVLALLGPSVASAFPHAQQTLATNLADGRALVHRHRFDLALVDLCLGDGNGQDLIALLTQVQPHCTVVVSTIYGDDDHLFSALQAGAQGYVLKDQPPDLLIRQLQGIADGHPPLSPAIARRLLRHFQHTGPDAAENLSLSAREREVLGLLAKGVRIVDIAQALEISRFTVGDHVKAIYRKLNIGSRAEAALKARSLGLI